MNTIHTIAQLRQQAAHIKKAAGSRLITRQEVIVLAAEELARTYTRDEKRASGS
ncbi:MAG: hypothetical protein GF398_04725 [Chitinivibrionales bacterium]|nr:hypothetical protein [Chitinivibrionales bacterium]